MLKTSLMGKQDTDARPSGEVKRVSKFPHGDSRTAGESPHRCPVCGATYIPDEQSAEIDGRGPLMMSLGDLCLKGGEDWLRAYYHDQEVRVRAE